RRSTSGRTSVLPEPCAVTALCSNKAITTPTTTHARAMRRTRLRRVRVGAKGSCVGETARDLSQRAGPGREVSRGRPARVKPTSSPCCVLGTRRARPAGQHHPVVPPHGGQPHQEKGRGQGPCTIL